MKRAEALLFLGTEMRKAAAAAAESNNSAEFDVSRHMENAFIK